MNTNTNNMAAASIGRNSSRRMLHTSKPLSLKLQLLLDVAVVEASLFLLVYLKGIQDFTLYYYPASIAPLLIWLIYSNSAIYRKFSGKISRALNLLWAWSKVMAILVVWAFVTKDSEELSRQVIVYWFFLAALLQVAVHFGVNHFIYTYILKNRQMIPSILVGNSPLGDTWLKVSTLIPGHLTRLSV